VRIVEAVVVAFLSQSPVLSYPCAVNSPLTQLSFLAGEWVGDPENNRPFPRLGVLGSGDFSAHYDLHQWVLILRSRQESGAAANERAGQGAEDMMLVYSGCGTDHSEGAVYVGDSRVYHFTFEVLYAPDRSRPIGVTFVSGSDGNLGPLRLTYKEIAKDKIAIEVQSGGAPAHISTASRRSRRASRSPTP